MWLSLVERCVRDAEAAGSNPVISTTSEACVRLDGPPRFSFSFFKSGLAQGFSALL